MAEGIEYINNKVYRKVAKANDVSVDVVETIMDFISESVAEVIVANDPKVSVKLDFMGNFFSKPGRRKIIEEKRIEKENGLITNGRRGEADDNPVCT